MHGTRILLGCIENRLFGMFSDPNYASVVSILTMIFSVGVAGTVSASAVEKSSITECIGKIKMCEE